MCKKLLFLISFVVVLGLVGNAFAATRHVGPGQRFATIDAAYTAAGTGDVIEIHAHQDGTPLRYSLQDGTIFKTDDSKHNITFQSSGTDHVIIEDLWTIKYKDGWTFDGLVWNNTGGQGLNPWSRETGRDQTGWTIKNCIFANNGHNALYFYGSDADGSEATTIENCTFFGNQRDAIRARGIDDYGIVKDCLFISNKHWDTTITGWSGSAMSYSNSNLGDNVYADYCTFFNNARNVNGPDGGYSWYGTDYTRSTEVFFASLEVNSPNFLYLSPWGNHAKILTGDSDGSYRGARPTPEPATIALLGLGGLALLRKRR